MWCPSPPGAGGNHHLVTVSSGVGGNCRPWGGGGWAWGGGWDFLTLSLLDRPVAQPWVQQPSSTFTHRPTIAWWPNSEAGPAVAQGRGELRDPTVTGPVGDAPRRFGCVSTVLPSDGEWSAQSHPQCPHCPGLEVPQWDPVDHERPGGNKQFHSTTPAVRTFGRSVFVFL